MRNNQRKCWNV